MSYYLLLFGLLIIGFTITFFGVMSRLGKYRWLYAGYSIPVYAQREVLHLGIPIGLMSVAMAFMILYPDSTWPGDILVFLFFATIVLAIWQPKWLKPAWLRWLEDNYGHVLEEMFAEARAMGRREWAEQVKTQEGLERWADSVAKKHGWRRLQR